MITNHPFYKVEEWSLRDFEHFRPTAGDPERIYLAPIGDGMELGMYVLPKSADVLRVGFHAAKSLSRPIEHEYSPVSISRYSGHAFVLFSDPTLTLGTKNHLSWYLGTPRTDPDDAMELAVRKLLEVTGAKHLIIEGSSAGGFVAMRFAARFRQSVAVPKIPQTDLFRYPNGPLGATLHDAWPGWTRDRILDECPHRFRLADTYRDPNRHRGGIVHYVQNAGDTTHVSDHLRPFLEEIDSYPHAFSALGGLISVSRPFVGSGHIPIPTPYWQAENQFALGRLRKMRTYREPETPFLNPGTSAPPSQSREVNLGQHLTKTW